MPRQDVHAPQRQPGSAAVVLAPQVVEVDAVEALEVGLEGFGLLGILLPRKNPEQTSQFPELPNPPTLATFSKISLRSPTR